MRREELIATASSVEVLHLLFYWATESKPRDQDFTGETLLSTILSSKGLLSIKELVFPSKPSILQVQRELLRGRSDFGKRQGKSWKGTR